VLQALIEAELIEAIGADRYERTETRTNQRNGHRDRLLTTKAGDVELKIPQLRKGSFFPSILEPRRRIDRALFAVVMESYVHGVSTRKVDDLVAALGAKAGISKSQVSRICAGLDTEMAAWRARRLDHVEFPYVYADATYLKGRVAGQVVSRAVVVVTGIAITGEREVQACAAGDGETEAFWADTFRGLRSRGLAGVRLVISDHHEVLKAAIAKCFVGAGWQRSRVQFMRNVLAKVSKANGDMVAAAMRTILRSAHRRRPRAVRSHRRDARAPVPRRRRHARRRPRGPVAVRGVPVRALAQDLVDEPARAAAPRDQASHRRRGRVPQRRCDRSARPR
jgi:transposase-like protein